MCSPQSSIYSVLFFFGKLNRKPEPIFEILIQILLSVKQFKIAFAEGEEREGPWGECGLVFGAGAPLVRKGLVFAIHSREFNLRLMCCWLEKCTKYPDAREMGTENSKINTGYWLIYSEGWFPKPGTLGIHCLPWFCVSLIWLGSKHRASQLLNHCPRLSQGWTKSRPEQTSRQTTKEKQLFCLAAALFLLCLASEQVNLGAQSS